MIDEKPYIGKYIFASLIAMYSILTHYVEFLNEKMPYVLSVIALIIIFHTLNERFKATKKEPVDSEILCNNCTASNFKNSIENGLDFHCVKCGGIRHFDISKDGQMMMKPNGVFETKSSNETIKYLINYIKESGQKDFDIENNVDGLMIKIRNE